MRTRLVDPDQVVHLARAAVSAHGSTELSSEHINMGTIQRTTSRRRLAAMMLCLWIFGLVAGIANACAFGGVHGSHGNSQLVPHGHDLTPTVEAHHHDEPAGVESTPQAPDPACQKFCEDGRSTLNLTLKGLGGSADLMPVLLQAPILAWTSVDVRGVILASCFAAVREAGPPIPIRLLRLTL
ncbi:hypothetical protein [Paucibacter sp. M5-1]|uniref:hypothetical protein n=1 Tax=Paucibacter sp. M5-1 TaxID=3015998 RepID=UPI0010F991AF|nr:hypothetical protein [Paucibacter sp. M5-1]MCZ7883094.1 hypothetical protein [Paucibacter sp. M5-1]